MHVSGVRASFPSAVCGVSRTNTVRLISFFSQAGYLEHTEHWLVYCACRFPGSGCFELTERWFLAVCATACIDWIRMVTSLCSYSGDGGGCRRLDSGRCHSFASFSISWRSIATTTTMTPSQLHPVGKGVH
ncbi:unnamed protein product [Ectocarpus sp. 6 AP-2014]